MTFRTEIAEIPFETNQPIATGILAPIMRATGHILYALAASSDEGYVITTEEILRELDHATQHLTSTITTADDAPLSQSAKSYIGNFCRATNAARTEYADWPEGERTTNLKNLANRAAALGAFLDLELAGIARSDPGTSL